jgi:hypothetical protein
MPEWSILAAAAVAALWQAWHAPQGDHANSRLATVYSLTVHRSWFIDAPSGVNRNPFEKNTVDKVMIRGAIKDGTVRGGRMISSKPPILPLIMTADYLLARPFMGWNLDEEKDADKALVWLSMSLIGSSYVLTLLFFVKTLLLIGIARWPRTFLLFAVAFGTQLFGFCGTINNHVPAAGALMAALYFGLGLATGLLRPSPWRFVAFGFAGGLVPTIDMPNGIYVAAAGLALFVTHPRATLIWAVLGALPPLGTHLVLTWIVTGSPLPVQMRPETYQYEWSYWRHPLGIDGLSEPKGTYAFQILFGRAGLFLLFPILTLGIAGAAQVLSGRDTAWRLAVTGGIACFGLLATYYTLNTNNYGGESYGFRWFIPSMPVLLLMAAPLFSGRVPAITRLVIAGLLAVSCYSAWECSQIVWESGREWTCRLFGPPYEQVDS